MQPTIQRRQRVALATQRQEWRTAAAREMQSAVMASVLVVFESKYGQSEKIAEFIAERARRDGHAGAALRIALAAGAAVKQSDAVVVVAPIYYGRHPEEVSAFLRAHVADLRERPTAFVAVSGAAGSKVPADRAKAEAEARAYVAKLGLEPKVVTTAGGAMAYPRYPFLMRIMLRFISARKGGPTDMSRIHETTDWDALAASLAPLLTSVSDRESAAATAQR